MRLAITPGDPLGIGPEVVFKGLGLRIAEGRPVDAIVIGDGDAIRRDAAAFRVPVVQVDRVDAVVAGGVPFLDPGGAREPVEVAAIRAAVGACLRGEASALVTGPIHKQRLMSRGFPYPGHTEFLGHLCGVDRPVMAFAGGSLMVALVTVHLPLRRVADNITRDLVRHVVVTADRHVRRDLGRPSPRIAVCGLNPHAGDGGVLGREEIDVIGPGVEDARHEGADAEGPMSAETAFRRAGAGDVDLVVAMYHDQGLAPLKLVDFGKSVNWTLGLPIVRTSVDHGTADDIVGKDVADPSSLLAAVRLAEEIVERRRA